MTSELAGVKHGVPERFVPGLMQGGLTEAEHVARYRLAAQLASERRVLDAGCGTGYGCALLAAAGARKVVGVDIAREVVDSVRADMPSGIRLETADVGRLPFDSEFDLVVCFNVIERVEDPGAALNEIVRVLAPDGIVLISSPNRAVAGPSSPHHRHLYLPEELGAELRSRLPHVAMMRQDVQYTVTLLADEDALSAAALEDVRRGAEGERNHAQFAVVVAGRNELPKLSPVAVTTSSGEAQAWYAAVAEQTALSASDRARILELELQTDELDAHLGSRDAELARARQALAAVTNSLSWRLTAPLRRLKRAARG